jgi:hypothetical protein
MNINVEDYRKESRKCGVDASTYESRIFKYTKVKDNCLKEIIV